MLGGGNSSSGIANDTTAQSVSNNTDENPQVPNDMDDDIPF